MRLHICSALIFAVLVNVAISTAAELSVIRRTGNPVNNQVKVSDECIVHKQLPSNTISSFGINSNDGIDYTLLPDIRKVTVTGQGETDSVVFVIVDANQSRSVYKTDMIDSITFIDCVTNGLDTIDTDGDGLNDFDELNRYFTDPQKTDTDGDGWLDKDELTWYSPENPHVWNPLIADLPRLEFVQLAEPSFRFKCETGGSISREVEVTNGRTYTEGQTRSSTLSSSYSSEIGWEFGFEAMAGFEDLKPKAEFTVKTGANGSYTVENSQEFGREWTSENETSFSRAEVLAAESSWIITGVLMSVPLKLRNSSPISYVIKSMTMTAYTMIPLGTGTSDIDMIASISQQDEQGFQNIMMKPNDESGEISFVNNSLTIDQARDWATRARNISITLAGYTIGMTDRNGNERDFTNEMTAVAASTARLRLDFGPGVVNKKPVEVAVAVRNQYNVNHSSANDMYFKTKIGDMLRATEIPVTYGEYNGNRGIVAVDGIYHEPDEEGYWFIQHCRPATGVNVDPTFEVYSVARHSFTLDTISVNPGDIIDIIYTKDKDNDGVPLRLETLYGASDSKVDSDGDGISDSLEIFGWKDTNGKIWRTDPANEDTDGDGLRDDVDPNPLRRPVDEAGALESVAFRRVNLVVKPESNSFDSISIDKVNRTLEQGGIPVLCPLQIDGKRVLENGRLHITARGKARLSGVEVWVKSLLSGEHDSVYSALLPVKGSEMYAFEGVVKLPDLDTSVIKPVRLRVRTVAEDGVGHSEYLFTINIAQPHVGTGDFSAFLASDTLGSGLTSYNGFRVAGNYELIGGPDYDTMLFIYSKSKSALLKYTPKTVNRVPQPGEPPSDSVRASSLIANPKSAGDFHLDITGLEFNQKYYLRGVISRRVGTSHIMTYGSIDSIISTGKARVFVTARKFLNVETWDYEDVAYHDDLGTKTAYGFTAEYIFHMFARSPNDSWHEIYIAGKRYMDMIGTPTGYDGVRDSVLTLETSDQNVFIDTLEPGDSLFVRYEILEDDYGQVPDVITDDVFTLQYNSTTSPTASNNVIIGPPSTNYSGKLEDPQVPLKEKFYIGPNGEETPIDRGKNGGKVKAFFYVGYELINTK